MKRLLFAFLLASFTWGCDSYEEDLLESRPPCPPETLQQDNSQKEEFSTGGGRLRQINIGGNTESVLTFLSFPSADALNGLEITPTDSAYAAWEDVQDGVDATQVFRQTNRRVQFHYNRWGRCKGLTCIEIDSEGDIDFNGTVVNLNVAPYVNECR